MTKKKQEIWQVTFKRFIAEMYNVGDNFEIVGMQNCNRKDLMFVMIKPHSCGRPKKELKE